MTLFTYLDNRIWIIQDIVINIYIVQTPRKLLPLCMCPGAEGLLPQSPAKHYYLSITKIVRMT